MLLVADMFPNLIELGVLEIDTEILMDLTIQDVLTEHHHAEANLDTSQFVRPLRTLRLRIHLSPTQGSLIAKLGTILSHRYRNILELRLIFGAQDDFDLSNLHTLARAWSDVVNVVSGRGAIVEWSGAKTSDNVDTFLSQLMTRCRELGKEVQLRRIRDPPWSVFGEDFLAG
ncbi:hypothetical protein HDU93_002888 [Gonapodya sp. JEL0774]|nr:hypothetical protein HDU93_002888 [Gonapodya sp. JEL0774]